MSEGSGEYTIHQQCTRYVPVGRMMDATFTIGANYKGKMDSGAPLQREKDLGRSWSRREVGRMGCCNRRGLRGHSLEIGNIDGGRFGDFATVRRSIEEKRNVIR